MRFLILAMMLCFACGRNDAPAAPAPTAAPAAPVAQAGSAAAPAPAVATDAGVGSAASPVTPAPAAPAMPATPAAPAVRNYAEEIVLYTNAEAKCQRVQQPQANDPEFDKKAHSVVCKLGPETVSYCIAGPGGFSCVPLQRPAAPPEDGKGKTGDKGKVNK